MKYLFYIGTLSLMLNSCYSKLDSASNVYNHSSRTLWFYRDSDTTTYFPDEAMAEFGMTCVMEPCSYRSILIDGKAFWKEFYYYVIDVDTVKKYGWNRVKNEKRYLQRYRFRRDNDEIYNGISYPPDLNMKDVEMYPPYGTTEKDRTCE